MSIDKALRILFIVATTLLTMSILGLFLKYTNTLQQATVSSQDILQEHVANFAENLDNKIKQEFKGLINDPFNLPPKIKKQMDGILSLFTGEQYPYIFVISRDNKDKFRYILDGSVIESEKGAYLQKFDPESLKEYEEAWLFGKPKWLYQDNLRGLWVTYLHPILQENKTKMLLVFDFSAKEAQLLNTMFSPVKNYLLIVSTMLGLFLLLVYIFGYVFYQQQKKTFIDPLTKLYNRNYLSYIARKIDLKKTSIAVMDVDHFKRINDTHGHSVGDLVLKTLAKSLKNKIRSNDIIIRYGGEEFLIFFQKSDDIKEIVAKIQQEISKERIQIENISFSITFSVGFNMHPHLNRSLEDAIDRADKMLYIAKTTGRNRIEYYAEFVETNMIFGPSEVSKALQENRIYAFYQPISQAKSGKINKFEALVRLEDENGNIVPPIKFLPHIKSNTVYRGISKFMLENALATIKKYDIAISVNFDVSDFLNKTLYEMIYKILSQNEQIASKVCIELLEDTQIQDFQKLSTQISRLQELGVSIAIDDFGTGYSTFSYLLTLNPNLLKIDGFLIGQLGKNKKASNIVEAIVRLCRQMDIEVLAEFVSDEIIKEECINLDIDYLQGYNIGKPTKNIEEFL